MPYANRATVVPNQAWSSDGTAHVTPQPPFPDQSTRTLPLEHRNVTGSITIYRSGYQDGLVVIPQGSQVSGPSAVLPLAASSGDSITLEEPIIGDWPDGIVVWFTS